MGDIKMQYFELLLTISFCCLFITINLCAENIPDQAKETLRFIRNVQNELKLTNETNVILFVGNTDSGKSTLAHYIAGDYSKLMSLEPTADEYDYTIYDGLDPDVEKVSSTTADSRTLVPEMLIDESNNVWYDCPAFSDTRNTTIEIATTFLIKSVIESARNVKIVLVVNHGSVVEGYDRFDLDKLLTHTTQLVRNIDRYKNSISMVVTKVEPYKKDGRNSVDVSESNIKNLFENYLNNYRNVLVERDLSSAKIQLVDALSQKSADGELRRIGVFWKPGEAGPLNKIAKMVEGRQLIRDTILQQTIYTEIQQNDFTFQLTDAAQIRIVEMDHITINEIHRISSEIDEKLLERLQAEIDQNRDIYERLDFLENVIRQIENVTALSGNATISDLIDRVSNMAIYSKAHSSDELKHSVQLERNLIFFRSVARNEIRVPINDFISEMFASTSNHIKREHAWSTLLVRVFEFLAGYEVQKDVTLYNVRDLKDWKIPNKTQGLFVTEINFPHFTKHFSTHEYTGVTNAKLDKLNEVINFTLSTSSTIECNGDSMTIKGNFFISSGVQNVRCETEVTKIRVLATGTFFVDSDINLDQDLEILAAKWIILNNFTFHLIGRDGDTMDKPDLPGTPGLPGNVGSNGHNFFGFANEIIEGNLLTVNISGGKGGNGQNGARNEDQVVERPSAWNSDTLWIPQNIGKYYKNYLTDQNQYAELHHEDVAITGFYVVGGTTERSNRYEVFPYKCCGKNGRGGRGGVGGLPGQHILITTSATNGIPKFVASNGSTGAGGNDPVPCKNEMAVIQVDTRINAMYIALHKAIHSNLTIMNRSPNPHCRATAEFISSSRPPATPRVSKPLQPATAIIEYKRFLRHKMADLPHMKALRIAYDAIALNAETNRMFIVKDLAVETNALETQFYELNGKLDVMPFYVNLLNRIEAFKDDPSFSHSTASEQRVVSLLYAHTLSKINSLKNGKNSDLIIDIEKYFEVVLNNINNLEQSGRTKVINDYRNSYKAALDAKISEGIDFIKNGIQTEIESLFHELDDDIRETVDEIATAQVKTLQEIKAKEKKVRDLQLRMFIRICVNLLNVVQKFVGDFGSVGKALLGGVVNGSLVGKGSTTPIVQSALETVTKIDREKLNAIDTELINLNDSLGESNPPKKQEIGIKLDVLLELAQKLISKGASEFFHDEAESLMKEFKKFVNEQVIDLKSEYGPIFEIVRNVSDSINVIESAPSLYEQYSKDVDKIDTISEAVKADQQKLQRLHRLEADIYSDLLPTFRAMQDFLSTTATELKHKSSIALIIQQARIQQMMRTVQKQLSNTMEGLGLASNAAVKECIVKIHEAINLIINIYDRIQNYEEQSNLFDHLAELQSADFRDIYAEDAQLKEILNELQLNLQSNALLAQYDQVVDGFKQAVFPFAADYLDIYQLPELSAAGNESRAMMISSAVDNIKSLSERIKEHNATVVNRNDAVIHTAYFNEKSGPFFIWSNDEVREQIRQLFSGQKIYLMANVARSNKLNAVKFNLISIKFRVTNSSFFPELDRVLLPFHVTMTHMGDSHYRCGNKFYTINSPSQEISYSFRRHLRSPIDRNAVYDKLNSGIALLSPYALWSVQLSRGRFEELAPYIGLVDIELHGYGKYVSENATVCDTELWRYYAMY